jgi:endonuclease/exonuclease/phosphatase family metal-dependent hydrolase
VKLLHWNIHMWRDLTGASNADAVVELVRRESPDVVSLVEVDEPADDAPTLRQAAVTSGYAWLFVPAFHYSGAGGFGNALLVRGEINAVQQWALLSPRLYDGSEPSEQRVILLANVTVDGATCWVGSTHLPRQESDERKRAADRLLHLLGLLGRPWVVCGDFNQPAGEWLPADLAVAPDPPTSTYPTPEPAEAIDYCIADGLRLTGTVTTSTGSDHLPVVATATPCRGGAE